MKRLPIRLVSERHYSNHFLDIRGVGPRSRKSFAPELQVPGIDAFSRNVRLIVIATAYFLC